MNATIKCDGDSGVIVKLSGDDPMALSQHLTSCFEEVELSTDVFGDFDVKDPGPDGSVEGIFTVDEQDDQDEAYDSICDSLKELKFEVEELE